MGFSRQEYWSGLPCPPPGGIFPTQGLNLGLPYCRKILYSLSHQGRPRILKWVAHPFSWASSWHRNWVGVSCISGGFFTSWATREPPEKAGKKVKVKVSQSCPTLHDPMDLNNPRNSPSQNTGVGSLSLLQRIFPAQGSNPGLPHCRWILCQMSHKGSSRMLEWVTYPFSSRSSWPRNQTRVSCIAGRFFTNWAIREAQNYQKELRAPYLTSRGKDPDLSALPPLPCCDHLWGNLRPRTLESRSSFLHLRTTISPQATNYSTEDFRLPVPVLLAHVTVAINPLCLRDSNSWVAKLSSERDYRQREHVIFRKESKLNGQEMGTSRGRIHGQHRSEIQLEHNEGRTIMRTFKKIELEHKKMKLCN